MAILREAQEVTEETYPLQIGQRNLKDTALQPIRSNLHEEDM